MKYKLVFTMLAVAAASFAASVQAQDADAQSYASRVCATCHGPGGNSISPAFPRLAGQPVAYLEAQLNAFRDKTRADPMAQAYMWGMSSQLDDATIKKLSAYYAAQKPVRGTAGDARLLAAGRTIYEKGIPEAKVQACVDCHGRDAAGNAVFPRLAGQHAEYLVKQMVLFKSQLRSDANAPMMHAVSGAMSFEQMQAVAAYLMSR